VSVLSIRRTIMAETVSILPHIKTRS